MHVAAVTKPTILLIHLFNHAELILLTSKEAKVSAKYFDFFDVFSSNSATEVLENTGINYHPINLINNKKSPYGFIFTSGLMELEIFKTYNAINLAHNFMRPFKYPAGTPILIFSKKNIGFRL